MSSSRVLSGAYLSRVHLLADTPETVADGRCAVAAGNSGRKARSSARAAQWIQPAVIFAQRMGLAAQTAAAARLAIDLRSDVDEAAQRAEVIRAATDMLLASTASERAKRAADNATYVQYVRRRQIDDARKARSDDAKVEASFVRQAHVAASIADASASARRAAQTLRVVEASAVQALQREELQATRAAAMRAVEKEGSDLAAAAARDALASQTAEQLRGAAAAAARDEMARENMALVERRRTDRCNADRVSKVMEVAASERARFMELRAGAIEARHLMAAAHASSISRIAATAYSLAAQIACAREDAQVSCADLVASVVLHPVTSKDFHRR